MFLSPHPVPLQGPLMPSPPQLMFDRADVVWNEMSGWPRYDRETDNTEVLCPVGMGIITDNIISSCGLLRLLYFFHTLPRSLKVCWDFPLLFLCYFFQFIAQLLSYKYYANSA